MAHQSKNSSPPENFSREEWLLWHRLQRQARRQGTWQDADEPLLEMLVKNIVLARLARREAEEEPFVAGSQGQLVAHPGLSVADRAETSTRATARALLLTPEARKKEGLVGGRRADALIGMVEGTSGLVGVR